MGYGLISGTSMNKTIEISICTQQDYNQIPRRPPPWLHACQGDNYPIQFWLDRLSHSIAFHRSLGMQLLGEPSTDGIPIVPNYAGRGVSRVVFLKST